jgi:hypothetical protein
MLTVLCAVEGWRHVESIKDQDASQESSLFATYIVEEGWDNDRSSQLDGYNLDK